MFSPEWLPGQLGIPPGWPMILFYLYLAALSVFLLTQIPKWLKGKFDDTAPLRAKVWEATVKHDLHALQKDGKELVRRKELARQMPPVPGKLELWVHLTSMQKKIAYLIEQGEGNEAICKELGLSISQLKHEMSDIRNKLDVRTRLQVGAAVREIWEYGDQHNYRRWR